MSVRIIIGDAVEQLKSLPKESCQMCVTSPPYWGLRDYGVVGQMGMEPTPEDFVAAMVEVFSHVRRVLAKDGTLWLNIGDSYAGSWGAQSKGPHRRSKAEWPPTPPMISPRQSAARELAAFPGKSMAAKAANRPGIKRKDLVGIPWMLAFALRADGWYLRSEIIWSKPNPMPESTKDRPAKSHEHIFLFSKRACYFYDGNAIKEPCSQEEDANGFRGGAYVHDSTQDNGPGGTRTQRGNKRRPAGWATEGSKNAIDWATEKAQGRAVRQRGHERAHQGFNSRWDSMTKTEQCSGLRNKRDVWTIATQPYSEAHFATFPEALIQPCILAGSRAGDTVLDPFGGSGTTGKVALELGRSAVLIELNPTYAAMAERRCNVTPGLTL